MSQELVAELRKLDMLVSGINRKYSNGILSPESVKKLTKLQILSHLQDKQIEINESKVEMLFDILNISTEYVSPIDKKRFDKLAAVEIQECFESGDINEEIVGDKSILLARWR
jgi:hypothetical protein